MVTNKENLKNIDKLKFENIPVLKEYANVFSEEILGLCNTLVLTPLH